MQNAKQITLAILVLAVALLIYFLPTILARKKPFVLKLFLLNLFAGFTIIGWVAVLIWALKKPKKISAVQANINANTLSELEKLNVLTKQGVLTPDEFDQQKAKILGNQSNSITVSEATKKKLQIISALVMLFVMLICLTFVVFIIPKYIYGEEATARRFLNSLQAGGLDSSLTHTNYITQTSQSIFPQIIRYKVQTVQKTNNNQYIIFAYINGRNSKGAWLSQKVGLVVQKNYDEYKIIDTYNLLIIHDGKIIFPNTATDLQKTEALKNLPNNLQIIDWDYRLNNGNAQGTGVIKNNANYPVKFIEAEIKYTNQNNRVIKANKIYVVDDSALNPGESRGFNSYIPNCANCNNANIYLLNNNN